MSTDTREMWYRADHKLSSAWRTRFMRGMIAKGRSILMRRTTRNGSAETPNASVAWIEDLAGRHEDMHGYAIQRVGMEKWKKLR